MLNAALIGAIAAAGAGNGTGGAALPEDEPLPTPLATKSANTGNISTALSGAQSGDRINLSNGSYGALTISASGTEANPLVVRASNLHGAVVTQLTLSGNWIIVSGIDVNRASPTGTAVYSPGSNNRVTRCLIHDAAIGVLIGAGAHDILIDHCTVSRTHDRMFYLSDPKDQLRITVARCWCHTLLAGGSTTLQSHCFIWADENEYREKAHDIVVRLSYMGPGTASGESSDYIHHKGSLALYAFNHWGVGGDLLEMRFGLRKRFVGNYAPGCPVAMYDDLGWYYGNSCGELRAAGARSAYYDDTKNLGLSVGGFHATKRTRISGNSSSVSIPSTIYSSGTSWCTTTQHATLPDPQPCGGVKPARSYQGINYAADDPDDPDVGIKIRDHTGTITQHATTCVNIPGDGRWQDNIDSQPEAAAPGAWLTELEDEYPWISGICPNPTSLTGGPSGTSPWSIAQALTRGDAVTPNTGPLRDSPGGLP